MKTFAMVAIGVVVVILGVLFFKEVAADSSTLEPETVSPDLVTTTETTSEPDGDRPLGDGPNGSGEAEVELGFDPNEPPPETVAEADDMLRSTFEKQSPVLDELLIRDTVIERLVAGADAVWRKQNPTSQLGFLQPEGNLGVERREGSIYLSDTNYERYEKHVKAFEALNNRQVVAAYQLLRPLFKQAHEKLGNPHVTWDQLVTQVTEQVQKTEVPTSEVQLLGKGKTFIFADPQLESLPAMQKALIRMGPDLTNRIQGKLEELMAELARQE